MGFFDSFRNRKPSSPNPEAEPAREEGLANFTPRAQQVLALSRREADRFNHNFVGTEHLLLGLISLGQGTAVSVLQKLGLDLEMVRMEVEKQVGRGPDQKMLGIPYTPRVKKVLSLAQKQARALHHTYVGTEHILLGLLREGDGVAARVLQSFNVDLEQTRHAILRELDPNFSVESRAEAPSPVVKPSLPSRAEVLPLDLGKRYDVFTACEGDRLTLYPNVSFKGCHRLFSVSDYDFLSEFLELAEEDGRQVFVSRYWMVKFHEHDSATASPAVQPIPSSQAQPTALDLGKRYDVTCTEHIGQRAIYRGARFKARRSVLAGPGKLPAAEFLELELSDGKTIFISRSSIRSLREHVTPVEPAPELPGPAARE